MNSLDALVPAAREGAGIVRAPSWQAEADVAAAHLVRLLTDYEPAPAPVHLMFRPSRLASPKVRSLRRILVQFFNRANWLWYTKPLINRVS